MYKNRGPRIPRKLLSKWHLLPIPMSRNLNTSSHCILISRSTRKTQHSQALNGTLHLQREEQDHLQQWVLVPLQPMGPSRHLIQGHGPIHIPLVPQNEGSHSLLAGDRYSSGLARYHRPGTRYHKTHMFKQNKRIHIESETEKYISKQSDKPSSSYEGSLSLRKEVFSDQHLFLCG